MYHVRKVFLALATAALAATMLSPAVASAKPTHPHHREDVKITVPGAKAVVSYKRLPGVRATYEMIGVQLKDTKCHDGKSPSIRFNFDGRRLIQLRSSGDCGTDRFDLRTRFRSATVKLCDGNTCETERLPKRNRPH